MVERSGIFNLGIEGTMLMGAVVGFLVADQTSSAPAGAAAALAVGAATGLVFGFFAVTAHANQVVAGLGITIAGLGVSAVIGKSLVARPAVATFEEIAIPGLSAIPVLGEIFFEQNLLVYLGYLAAPLVWLVLMRTRPGLHLRAAGENPDAGDAMGVNVALARYSAVVFGGALAGLAGSYFSLAFTPGWSENMTGGRGYIALALVIFATWNPMRLLGGAFLFGTLEALAFRAQVIGVDVPSAILGMLPFIATILVLVLIYALGAQQRLGAPRALGIPFLTRR